MIKHKLRDITNLAIGVLIIVIVMLLSYFSYVKFDLTEDQRFTLNKSSLELLHELDDIVEFKVYVESKYLPADLTRVRNSIQETLEEFSDLSDGMVEYEFINIYEDIDKPEAQKKELLRLERKGINIIPIPITEDGELKTQNVALGAEAFHNGRSIAIPFIRQAKGDRTNTYEKAIEELEFELTNGIRKLRQDSMKTVAFLQGHNELGRADLEDYTKGLYEYYNTGPAYLSDKNGDVLINALDYIDLLIIAKPQTPFNQKEQFVLDQYIMNGGKVLWMLDGALGAELDSLQFRSFILPTPLETGLEPMIFKYGVRLNKHLVQDLSCSKIPIQATTNGNGGKFQLFNWVYNPLLQTRNNHIINKNLDPVKTEFSSSLDSLPNPSIKFKTLLQTSGYNRYQQIPSRVSFTATATGKINTKDFNQGSKPIALLIEGMFESYFNNRLAPSFTASKAIDFKKKSIYNNMIVIADGDMAKNWYNRRNEMIPLGTDQFTNVFYDNKKFLINCANYLLGDDDLIAVRSKNIKMRLLDGTKVKSDITLIKLLNVGLPIAIIILFSVIFIVFRKSRFGK